ncbi:MAG: class I SAM-dependent rRNA methyltransferase, partial [Atopobiaceae bacterium]|nr:class I SAM-dependent rRNA methyltransferase [Atopobiaceae bacterium]
TDCCRVIFSEADGFPGLIVDRYEDVLVSQVGTVGMERLRGTLYPLLNEVLREDGQRIEGIYERNDVPSRDKEGLLRYQGWWNGAGASGSPTDGDADPRVVLHDAVRLIHENGIAYTVDFENSQKTGFFLDQKYNRRAVRAIAKDKRVLDCFCHVGPFALNAAAGGAAFVRGVDVSEVACELARRNAELNGLSEKTAFTCANVLEYLPALREDRTRLREEGGPFDLIVLDPPAFTKSRRTADSAARGYKQINHDALRLLPRGGYLATCSCSHFMPAERLERVVAEAAHDAGVQLNRIEARQQAPDHPVLIGMPETEYLKFFLYQVV